VKLNETGCGDYGPDSAGLCCDVMERVMNIPTHKLWRTVGVAVCVVWTGTGWTRMRPQCRGEVNSLVTG